MTAHEDEPPRRWWRRAARLRAAGHKRPAAVRRRRRVKPALIGENATLLGAVMPLPPSETVPLIANDDQDFGVVRELLTEHYAAFEKGWFEVGYDDSDPTWKDFLFGPLSRELGALVRGDGVMKTFALTWEIWLTRLPWLVRAPGEMLRAGYLRFLSHYVAALPDAHAALNSARDHLVQYLCLQRDGCADDLTAHADASALLYTSHRLLARTAESKSSQQPFQTTLRNRLLRLSRYLNSPYLEVRQSRLGWAAVALVLAGLATAAGVAVKDALDYHPIFVERMHQAEMESADHGKRQRL
jgi:hypothetical protein